MSGVLIQRQARVDMFDCVMYIIRNNCQKQLPEWKITIDMITKHGLCYLIRTTVGGNNENVRIDLVNMCNN